ncbi:hypothetical protein Btru_065806 [Bulinus truncatus]|nr:hypothetical protein Btru_065806 [Bulinus truncatus]
MYQQGVVMRHRSNRSTHIRIFNLFLVLPENPASSHFGVSSKSKSSVVFSKFESTSQCVQSSVYCLANSSHSNLRSEKDTSLDLCLGQFWKNLENAGVSPQGFQGPFAGQLQSAPPLLPATSNQWQQPQTFGSPVNPGTVSLSGQGTPFTTDDGRTFLFYPQFANLQLAPGGDLGTSQGNNNNQDQGFRRGPGNGQWRRKHLVQRQLNSGRVKHSQFNNQK